MDRTRPFRRRAAAAVIVAALPLPILVSSLTGSGHLTLASCVPFVVAAAVAGPRAWPGERRAGSLVVCFVAALTLVVGMLFVIFPAFFALCSSDQSRDYLSPRGAWVATAGFAVPYVVGSAWAVDDEERVLWAWPVVILLTLAIGVAVLALVEGGPHHCET